MITVGLTGGIGSGKTTIAGFFRELEVPVYIADEAGKRLMETSEEIRNKIIEIFGKEAYKNGLPDRKLIASRVFKDKALLEKLNNIIHPAVADDFNEWKARQKAAYVLYEAAILFETGAYKKVDFSILVTAPKETRIKRLQKRDNSSPEEIADRMNNQWDDERKSKLADFVIENTDLGHSREQVKDIHFEILKAGQNSQKFC
ncbi:dephospho-CoA kinase [Christiangramia fulva]|uniref:Dephospho-CoA kinase n=1 Tax=Christiangramia fulva TaxID=2126553 RepID=A0A2R3Z0W0_9FLAO|nr:dephospho-CoA kinase [Christiangramia fulva]AVR43868.1 dephospho-CoA kinase [Christiangramia fulva]